MDTFAMQQQAEHYLKQLTPEALSIAIAFLADLAHDAGTAQNETEYLSSIPNMKASIIEGLNTPIDKCDKELDW